MKALSLDQMEIARGGQMENVQVDPMDTEEARRLSAGCISSLIGLGAAFVGIFCISGPLGAAVWYVGTMATAVGTGVSC